MSEEPAVIIASETGIAIQSMRDIPEVLNACFGSAGLLLTEQDLTPAFFDLHTGIAGELFQKFTNYRLRLAIVLPDPKASGARFSELAYEHRPHPTIRFFPTLPETRDWLRAAQDEAPQ